MAVTLKDLHVLALSPTQGCPPGLERAWMTIILKAMSITFQRQCHPQPNDDADHLDALFCCLVDQWNSMRALALTRGDTLDPAERAEHTVDEFRALFCVADAINDLLPADET